MGEHDTFYTLLMPEFWARLEGNHPDSLGVKEVLGREWQGLMFRETHFTLIHVASALIAAIFILVAALAYRKTLTDSTNGVVPSRSWNLGAMMGNFVGVVYDYAADVMGEDNAKRYLPLIGTLALFIFCNNIQGLIPGFLPGTDTLKTNLALALIVFLTYNFLGLRANGLGHLAHFLGPKFGIGGVNFPWLFWLFLPIEIASHIGRPVSLSLRLMGNLMADHKVVGVMLFLFPLLLPVPFLVLGTLVAIIQTLVFTLLTIVYIGTAIEHAEEH
jgi:F-type H+-transporting ATPase subunit a